MPNEELLTLPGEMEQLPQQRTFRCIRAQDVPVLGKLTVHAVLS